MSRSGSSDHEILQFDSKCREFINHNFELREICWGWRLLVEKAIGRFTHHGYPEPATSLLFAFLTFSTYCFVLSSPVSQESQG